MTDSKRLSRVALGFALTGALLVASAADARRGRGGDDRDDDRFEDRWDDHRGRHGDDHRRFDDDRFEDHHHSHHGVRWERGHRSGRHGEWWFAFDGPRLEIEAHVVGIDRRDRLVILETGEALRLPAGMPFHPDGDLFHFDRLAWAVEAGAPVEIEGFATPTENGWLTATALKVEIDD